MYCQANRNSLVDLPTHDASGKSHLWNRNLLRMIQELLSVGLGSFLGGIFRYGISLAMKGMNTAFPWATLTANIAGCLLIGIICAVFKRYSNLPFCAYLFLTVGFCGGFTTFSTFSKESLLLLQTGQYRAFLIYALGSVFLGLLAVVAGYSIIK